MLLGLIGEEVAPIALAARDVKPVLADDLDVWERKLEQQLVNDSTVPETERRAIIRARNGQGLFKERVARIETRCRITGVETPNSKSLQAVAGRNQRGATKWREWPAFDAEH